MKKTPVLLFFLFMLVIISSACSSQEEKATQPETTLAAATAENSTTSTAEVTQEPAAAEPSTKVEEEFVLPQDGVRPVAVMIDNEGTRVLPQGGLDKAQIVYEVIVEGGLTRLMPVFWGTNPEMIGPVRSSRDYFLDYSMEYDAIYTHVGGSPQALSDIKKLKINDIDGMHVGKEVIWDLTKDKGNWQDSYTSMKALLDYAGIRGYRTTTEKKFPFTYYDSVTIPEAGSPAGIIFLDYPSMSTKYVIDESTGRYKRFRQEKPQIDRVSGKQLEAENIIIQFVPNYDIKGDKAGRQEMNTLGSGKGYFITRTKCVKIKWSKDSRSSQTIYTDEAGNPIRLNKGQTWIQIMPVSGKVNFD